MLRGPSNASPANTYVDWHSSFEEDVNTGLTQIPEILSTEARAGIWDNQLLNLFVQSVYYMLIHTMILTFRTRGFVSG